MPVQVSGVMCTVFRVTSVFRTLVSSRSRGVSPSVRDTGIRGVRIGERRQGVRVIRVPVTKEVGTVSVLVNLKVAQVLVIVGESFEGSISEEKEVDILGREKRKG